MCKVSRDAAQAFIERCPFRRGGTEVVVYPSGALLRLHGVCIGENASRIRLTMAGYGTQTTASRLNAVMQALGSDIRWRCKDARWRYGDRVLEDLTDIIEVEV